MCSSNMQVNSGSPISRSFFGLCSLSYTMEKIKTPHSPLAFGKLERQLKICWYHCKQWKNETLDRQKDQGCWGCSVQDSGGGADGRQGDPGPTPVISRRHRVECISVGSPKNPPKSSTRRGKWCFCRRGPQSVAFASHSQTRPDQQRQRHLGVSPGLAQDLLGIQRLRGSGFCS